MGYQDECGVIKEMKINSVPSKSRVKSVLTRPKSVLTWPMIVLTRAKSVLTWPMSVLTWPIGVLTWPKSVLTWPMSVLTWLKGVPNGLYNIPFQGKSIPITTDGFQPVLCETITLTLNSSKKNSDPFIKSETIYFEYGYVSMVFRKK
ncbi:hypothetical protein DMA11_03235 [Marinilabiliaceae bacterium JC017]|nr:hypothetical protein DMA11_03235 [Marinilabiliaceae bacterium JC017]